MGMARTTASPSLDESEEESEEHDSAEDLQAQATAELGRAERELDEIKRLLQEPIMTREGRD